MYAMVRNSICLSVSRYECNGKEQHLFCQSVDMNAMVRNNICSVSQ